MRRGIHGRSITVAALARTFNTIKSAFGAGRDIEDGRHDLSRWNGCSVRYQKSGRI